MRDGSLRNSEILFNQSSPTLNFEFEHNNLSNITIIVI